MLLKDVMSELESLGTEQTRKTYRRHGSGDNVFGVLFGDLKTLAKKIKRDHQLACQLWNTENVDARSLATMILEPEQLDEKTTLRWVSQLNYHALASLLAGCIAQSRFARTAINKWTDSDNAYVRQCGYDTLAQMLKTDNSLSNHDCQKSLDKIEKELDSAPNRVRSSMNSALIAIGTCGKPDLTNAALKCADRIGKVEIDHGDTNCKTPDARAYIIKTLNRKPKSKVATR